MQDVAPVSSSGGDRSISVGRDAFNSVITSGDGNVVNVYYQVAAIEARAPTEFGANPYVGLLAFTELDADRFFGREALVERLWEKFQDLTAEPFEGDRCRLLAITSEGKALGKPLGGHTGPISRVAFFPDGSGCVTGSVDGSLRLWDARPESPAAPTVAGGGELLAEARRRKPRDLTDEERREYGLGPNPISTGINLP